MKLMPQCRPELLTILLSSDYLVLSWLKKQKKEWVLKGYTRITRNKNSPLFSLQGFHTQICSFIKQHKLQHAYSNFIIDRPTIHEKIVTHTKEAISLPDLGDYNPAATLYDYMYLYPQEPHTKTYYTIALDHAQLFHYKLLAIKCSLNILAITTKTIGLLQWYKYVHGAHFRQTQLGLDLQRNNNAIEQVVTATIYKPTLLVETAHSISLEQEARYLQPMMGIACVSHPY